MIQPRRAALAALLLLALSPLAAAQEPPAPDDLQRRLDALEKRVQDQERTIEELRGKPAEEPAADEKPAADTPAKPADPEAPPPVNGAKGEAPKGEAGEKPSKPTFDWGWKDGIFIKGTIAEDVPFELRPIGRIQLDYRVFAPNDPNDEIPHAVPENQFLARRARIGFSGTISDFGFVFEVDPTRNQLPLGVFYFQWQAYHEARLRFGHFRTPFALENGMLGTNQLPWLERSMVIGSGNALAPGFSPGGMAFGTIAKTFSYYLAAQNRVDSNNQVTSDPLLSARLQLELGGLTLGGSCLWVRQGGTPQQSMTGFTPGQFRFFAPVLVQGHDVRGGVDAAFFTGPFFVMAEYGYGEQERRRVFGVGRSGSPFAVQGGYVGAGVVLWGPNKGVAHAKPFQNWTLLPDLDRPKLGRFAGAEVFARAEWIDLDDRNGGRSRNATGGVAVPSRAADAADIKGTEAKAVTLGINVFPI